jgi:POT family proton-dependent oligopeptide transporter
MQDHVALDAGGFRIPVPWYQSIDPLFSILAVPVLFWLWARQALRGREPNDLGKIGIGAWLAAASNLFLVVPILVADGAAVHPVWPFLYCAGMGVAFLHYWPTLLALVSRTAPAQVNATMMGVAFMSLFVSNNLIGWIGTHYERMTPAEFWTLHAAIGATGGMLVLVFGRRLTRALAGAAGQPLRPSAQTLEVER